jgi:hypothetical protein
MALALEFEPGEDFYIRDDRYELIEIHSHMAISVRRDRDGKTFELTDHAPTQLADNVEAYVGTRGRLGSARIAFKAERSISVMRGTLYRNKANSVNSY